MNLPHRRSLGLALVLFRIYRASRNFGYRGDDNHQLCSIADVKSLVMSGLLSAFELVRAFKGQSLANRIAFLERDAEHKSRMDLPAVLTEAAITSALMRSAIEVKRAASQIDEVVHAIGTLLALPDILEEGEIVESISLGAGNTGRDFDLETDRRIAEFTFIDWKGGPESIRKQKLFKDFYCLAESETSKRRFVYVLGDDHAQRVFTIRSSCKSMLRKFADLQAELVAKYGAEMTVREYFDTRRHLVAIVNLKLVSPTVAHAFESVEAAV
jgi:hypothetical protein